MKLAWSKTLNYIYLGAADLKRRGTDLLFFRRTLVFSIIGLSLNLLSWLLTAGIQRGIGSGLAILHYNVIFGVDLIGEATNLYLWPTFGFGLLAVNFLLAAILASKQERFIAYLLLGMASFGNLLILWALYFIYLVNFS